MKEQWGGNAALRGSCDRVLSGRSGGKDGGLVIGEGDPEATKFGE